MQFRAKRKALVCAPSTRAISRGSGGTGKKEDSTKDRMNRAGAP